MQYWVEDIQLHILDILCIIINMLHIVFYELCTVMREETGQPCSISCAIRKVNYLTDVYNAQTEVVETICAMYEM